MKITLNGKPRDVPEGATVADLVRSLQVEPRYVAVERNRELVPRTRHEEQPLNEGDELEIVTLVGGGSQPNGHRCLTRRCFDPGKPQPA